MVCTLVASSDSCNLNNSLCRSALKARDLKMKLGGSKSKPIAISLRAADMQMNEALECLAKVDRIVLIFQLDAVFS